MMRPPSGRGKRMAMPPPLNALGSGNDACVSRAVHQRIDPMMRYAPQTVGVLRTILDGLDPDMPVELERGVPLVAATVADLRALDAWPPLPSAWTARAPGGTTSSSSGCGQIRG